MSGLFARTRDHEGAIPVALALLQVLRCLRNVTWLAGMDLHWSDAGKEVNGETDFVALTENYERVPELLLAECKTNLPINEAQIDRLIATARRFAGTEIKTFIVFAKAGSSFSADELELLDARQTIDLSFILLTPAELEPYHPYENAKSHEIRKVAPNTLTEWANYSSFLYLKTQQDEVWRRHFEAHRKVAG